MTARCTHVELFGQGYWQCEAQDPHPAGVIGHVYPIDATEYGRNLEKARPEWLAAEVRMLHARLQHAESVHARQRTHLMVLGRWVARLMGASFSRTRMTRDQADAAVAALRPLDPEVARLLADDTTTTYPLDDATAPTTRTP